MQIVHVVRQFHPSVGGLEDVVRRLAVSQVEKRHQVRIVTLDRVFGSRTRLPAREQLDGIDVIRVPFWGSKRYPLAFGVIRHIRDADIVHVHGIDFLFDYLAWTRPLHRARLVASTHGGYFHTPYASIFKRLYFPTVTRASLSGYAGVAAVSAADEALFRRVRSRGLSLIENGVDIERYAGAGSREPKKAMLTIGRFSTNKRLDRLIEFMVSLRRLDPQWQLKIVGRPADLSEQDVLALARNAGVEEAVEVVASAGEDGIRAIMGDCSIIVSSSEYEGFGLTAVEGLSAGLVPALNDIPPFRQLVDQTGLGMVLDFSDSERASAEFVHRWSEVEALYRDHREAAMLASGRYAWSGVSDAYERFYRSALGIKVRSILDVAVEAMTAPEAVELLDSRAAGPAPTIVCFANAHTLNQTVKNERAREALQRAVVLNDGLGVDLASRLLFGRRFPENLNGTDFVPAYLRRTRHRYRLFLLGSRPEVAERAAARLKAMAPQHQIVGCHHGYLDACDTDAIVERIRDSGADVLLVAMGNPQQELWLTEHLAATGCRLGIGVGALFDFLAGAVPRAPQWMRRARIEWAYRMMLEPGRLWRRYLVGMPLFLMHVGRQWMAGARVSRIME